MTLQRQDFSTAIAILPAGPLTLGTFYRVLHAMMARNVTCFAAADDETAASFFALRFVDYEECDVTLYTLSRRDISEYSAALVARAALFTTLPTSRNGPVYLLEDFGLPAGVAPAPQLAAFTAVLDQIKLFTGDAPRSPSAPDLLSWSDDTLFRLLTLFGNVRHRIRDHAWFQNQLNADVCSQRSILSTNGQGSRGYPEVARVINAQIARNFDGAIRSYQYNRTHPETLAGQRKRFPRVRSNPRSGWLCQQCGDYAPGETICEICTNLTPSRH